MKPKLITYRDPKLNAIRQISRPLLNISSRAAQNTFRGLVKHQSETNRFNQEHIKILETQQSFNFLMAECTYRNRRVERSMAAHHRLEATGKADSYLSISWGWIFDGLLFVLDLIWGVIQPILYFLVIVIVRVVLSIAFTALIIYIIYKLLTI